MIIIPQLKIGYQDLPKIASTSIKIWLYKMLYGTEFERYKDPESGDMIHIHNYIPRRSANTYWVKNNWKQMNSYSNYYRFAVTRDPVKRFVSMYSNRVLYHKELSRTANVAGKIAECGLFYDPDINTLVDNLEAYLNISRPIFHHARPMMDFISPDISVCDRIMDVSEVGSLMEEVKEFWTRRGLHELVNRTPERLPKLQTGGPKIGLESLSPQSFEYLLQYYHHDYEFIPTVSLDAIKDEFHKAASA